MSVSHALTIAQPWASLIAAGHKTIETRPAPPSGDMRPDGVRGLPGAALHRGERIAIHAAAYRWGPHSEHADRIGGLPSTVWRALRAATDGHPLDPDRYPLGAIVATAIVAMALPIIDDDGDLGLRAPWQPHITLDEGHGPEGIRLWYGQNPVAPTTWLTVYRAERPLGDYTPGRWGWLLTDVEPLPEPLPMPGRQGVWTLTHDQSFDLDLARPLEPTP